MSTTPENSLGLQLEQLQITDAQPAQPDSPIVPILNDSSSVDQSKKKQKPYINPERFRTGGPQREKPSEEELAERMQRIKAQNERIKQRRLDVEADEEAFRKTEQEERIKLAQTRKVQETVNRARDQNARRKLERIQSREWDTGKPTLTAESKLSASSSEPQRLRGSRGRPGRGMRRGESKGLGQGRDTSHDPTTQTVSLAQVSEVQDNAS